MNQFQRYPLQAQIHASAFASASFEGDASPGEFLGGPTVRNQHTTAGLGPNGEFFHFEPTRMNFDYYSMHTYGKTGAQFTQLLRELNATVNAAHLATPPASSPALLPISITEHAVRTSGSWNELPSNADASFESSRLASQLLRSVVGALFSGAGRARGKGSKC